MTPQQAVRKVRFYVRAQGYAAMLGWPAPGVGGWVIGVRTTDGRKQVITVPHAEVERVWEETKSRRGAKRAKHAEHRCALCGHAAKHDRARGCLHFDGRGFCPCKG